MVAPAHRWHPEYTWCLGYIHRRSHGKPFALYAHPCGGGQPPSISKHFEAGKCFYDLLRIQDSHSSTTGKYFHGALYDQGNYPISTRILKQANAFIMHRVSGATIHQRHQVAYMMHRTRANINHRQKNTFTLHHTISTPHHHTTLRLQCIAQTTVTRKTGNPPPRTPSRHAFPDP